VPCALSGPYLREPTPAPVRVIGLPLVSGEAPDSGLYFTAFARAEAGPFSTRFGLPGRDRAGIVALVLSGVAQLAERRTVNPQVVGSIPTPGAIKVQVRAGLSGLALSASRPAFQNLSNLSPLPDQEKRSDLLAGLPGPSRIGVPVDVRRERRRVVAHLGACRW
jgi:hypothetical protein